MKKAIVSIAVGLVFGMFGCLGAVSGKTVKIGFMSPPGR